MSQTTGWNRPLIARLTFSFNGSMKGPAVQFNALFKQLTATTSAGMARNVLIECYNRYSVSRDVECIKCHNDSTTKVDMYLNGVVQ